MRLHRLLRKRNHICHDAIGTVVGAAAAAVCTTALFPATRSLVLPVVHRRSRNILPLSTTTLLPSAFGHRNNRLGNYFEMSSSSTSMHSNSGSFRDKLELPTTTTSLESIALPLVLGHRGSLYQALENTRPSFQHCIDMGCDGFELDVYAIADGTLVVFHGNDSPGLRSGDFSEYCSLVATTSAAAAVNKNDNSMSKGGVLTRAATSIVDLTFAECQQMLRFNPDFAEFVCPKDMIASSRIPTLEEILKDVKDNNTNMNNNKKMVVKIELKGPNTVEPVLKLVERMDMVDVCCYSSFDLSQIKLLRQLRPSKQRYPTGALFGDLPQNFVNQALEAGATEIHLRYDDCTPSRITAIHKLGLGTMAWMRGPRGMQSDCSSKYYTDVGNEDDRMYQALLETGVQQVCVNKPNILLEFISKQRQAAAALPSSNAENKY